MQNAALEHIGLVVKDVDKTIELWTKLFGISNWTRREVDTTDASGQQRKARFANGTLGPLRIELLQPVAGMKMQSDFLATHGEGMHHLGFSAEDVEGTVKDLTSNGARVLNTTPGRLAFLEIGDKGGVVVEFVQRQAQR